MKLTTEEKARRYDEIMKLLSVEIEHQICERDNAIETANETTGCMHDYSLGRRDAFEKSIMALRSLGE